MGPSQETPCPTEPMLGYDGALDSRGAPPDRQEVGGFGALGSRVGASAGPRVQTPGLCSCAADSAGGFGRIPSLKHGTTWAVPSERRI